MKIRYILKKQLATLPCRFILGCIGHSKELSPEINQEFLHAIKDNFGPIEDVLPVREFPNAPKNYLNEMGNKALATTMIILEQKGAYTNLHYLKKDTERLEGQFLTSSKGRIFNINPGAVGRYGLCLSSHKPTGGRQDISTYAFGFHPHLLFGGDSYYERISRWTGDKMELIDYIKEENKFSEYYEGDRLVRFSELVKTLGKSDAPVELMSENFEGTLK